MWTWIAIIVVALVLWYLGAFLYLFFGHKLRPKPPLWERLLVFPLDVVFWLVGAMATIFDPKGYGD